MLVHQLQHVSPIALQLRLTDAAHLRQGIGGGRTLAGNRRERDVMEDDIGRYVVLGGALPAPPAQGLEQRLVRRFDAEAIAAPPFRGRSARPSAVNPADRSRTRTLRSPRYTADTSPASPRPIRGRPVIRVLTEKAFKQQLIGACRASRRG